MLLPLCLAGLGYGLTRAYAALYAAIGALHLRRAVVSLLLLVAFGAVAAAVLLPGEELYEASSLPRLGAELASLGAARRHRQELRRSFASWLRTRPRQARPRTARPPPARPTPLRPMLAGL